MSIPNIYVCFRVHNTTGQIIAAFKNVKSYAQGDTEATTDCFLTTVTGNNINDVQHDSMSLDQLHYETRAAHKHEFVELLELIKAIYEVEMQGCKAYIKPARALDDRSAA